MTAAPTPNRPRTAEENAQVEAGLIDLHDRLISFNQLLQLKTLSLKPGDVRSRIDMRPELVGHFQYGRLHGGASVALAETGGSVAAAMTIDHSKFATVGMDINANHVRPAMDGFVYATATSESIGRTTQIWSVRIEDEAGKLVCISRITMAVISMDRAS